ncbi:hypothetical protein F5883DRAFT_577079 [Diaporthe sp. PMI_573]|nr:hypothetical protein F5883DRAFT_577079 [Diaporthaceae sp. PMI_573]
MVATTTNLRETQEAQSMHEMEFLAINLMDRVLASLAKTDTLGPSPMELSLLYLLGAAAMVVAAKFVGGTDLTLPHLAYTANVDDMMMNGENNLENAIQRLRYACFGRREHNVNTSSWDLDSDSDGSCATEGPGSTDDGVPLRQDTQDEREKNGDGILKTPERPKRPSSGLSQ